MRDSIKSALSKSLNSALKNTDWQVRTAWTGLLIILAQGCVFLWCFLWFLIIEFSLLADFQDNIQSGIPQLIETAAADEDDDVRMAGIEALTFLAKGSVGN